MATTRVTYSGPFAAVDMNLGGVILTVRQGETVEVDAEEAAALLEQPDNWQPAAAGRSRGKADETTEA
jgi:hypothetical protein